MNNEDLSDIFKKINNTSSSNNISPDMINNLINMLNNSNSVQASNKATDNSSNQNSTYNNSDPNFQDNSFNTNGLDIETIMKMKNIIDKMNVRDDPRSNLLQSLKPYLKESRKSKIDQYIQLMNMSKVIDVFPFIGGDKKNNG